MAKRRSSVASRASKVDFGFNNVTWWLVDLKYNVTGGATPLVKRCMKEFGWDEEHCRQVLRAYKQFLRPKADYRDFHAEVLSPSSKVDQMWHMHMLDTRNYALDCDLLCGDYVHHDDDEGMILRLVESALLQPTKHSRRDFPISIGKKKRSP